jgi:hypothetical protein
MEWSKWVVLILVLVPMMSMVSLKPEQSHVCSLGPVGYHDTDAVVLAAYQVWFGMELDPPSVHQCAFSGEPLLPNKRPYNSNDLEVISRHIQEAKERGISGFVVDWYGPEADLVNNPGKERKFMDDATIKLFEEAESQDFLVALMYDVQTVKYAESDPAMYESRVKSDLEYAEKEQEYFGSPAYLKINDKPALFIFPDDEVKPYLNWTDIRNHLSSSVTLIDWDPNPKEQEYDDYFDGFYAWVKPTNGEWHPEGLEWGREYLEWFYRTMQSKPYENKVAVGGVWPGFDDSLAAWSENRFMARFGTRTHDKTLKLAKDSNVQYIMVSTWNDFEEGTDIEYGVHMRVDMDDPDPELLIRSTPVMVCWSSDIGCAPLQVYTRGAAEPIYDQQHCPGVYLSLTPGNIYELKIWTSGSTFLNKWIKIRRFDPLPDADPVLVETKTITVTSPSRGESWQVNSSQTITWTSTGSVGNVNIQYSLENGCNWSTITSSTENDGSFPWTVPDMVSEKCNKCLIRVSETDGVAAGTSAMFSIVPISSITITSPNGGENWDVGSQRTITWTSEGPVGNLVIEYSINGGTSWKNIVLSTENDGSYNWRIPNRPSNYCLVRVTEPGGAGSPSDVSDAVFSIVSTDPESVTIRSPNGGEGWTVGSAQQIKWNTTGDINQVTIKYSKDNGTTWKTIAQNVVNNHSYNWVVPGTASDQCLVRVAANDSDLDPKPSDVSDAVFSILLPPSPTIKVTAPNGGEQLVVGSRFTITWDAANTREDVRIEYSINGGQNWREIIAAAGNNGKYDWTVPDAPSDNCLVRVSETDGQPSDVSDALFSIVSPVPGEIMVNSPNGGETWTAGSSQEIKWTAAGIDQVKIEYSQDHGTTWETIIQTTPNSGSFDWTIPGIASDECLVRITSNDANSDPIPADISDTVFSIVPPASPTITVIAPNGGEQLTVGSSINITWNAVNSREDVKIEYSVNGGEQWTIITDAADNNGDYEWIVPDTPSDTCLVRISEIDGQPVDISDAVFSIVRPVPGEITVIAPNGGESWTASSIKEISWTAGGINNVTIEYSTDYGTTWKVIVQTTPNNGSFDWTIPDTVSDECLVRVSSYDGDPDPIPSDVSDLVFSIVPDAAGEFRVTSPNGGESWEVGSTQSIKWTNSGDINNVMIEYSYDNGNTWSTLISSIENSGTYDWTIPDTVSDECLVRVSANDGEGDPKPTDVSDEVFSILRPSSPTIRVITPNGGEQLVIGTQYEITWFGTDSRAEVKIEYSINGGETWTGITGSTENDGEYDWLVPDEPSEKTCLVRISEIDGQPVDVSDAVFSIVQPQISELTVLTPNGGEYLESGSEYNITWNSSGLNNVILEYSVNNGASWLYIDKVPADNDSYTWTVPGTPSEICLVRITGADSDENPSDVSDGVFTIFDPSQASIEVFTPNGGESLSVGEEYYITWASSGINNVLIEYSTTNGEEWIPIDTVPAIGGRFTWTVPDAPSESCLIRVTGNDSPGDPSDVSDSPFSIISN